MRESTSSRKSIETIWPHPIIPCRRHHSTAYDAPLFAGPISTQPVCLHERPAHRDGPRQLPFVRRRVVSRCQLQHDAVVTPPWSAADVAAAESLPCCRCLPPPIRLGLLLAVITTAAVVPTEYLTDDCKLYRVSRIGLYKIIITSCDIPTRL